MNGCDSIISTTLTVLPVVSIAQQFMLCQGESVTVGNQVYSQAGVYVDTLQTPDGCDSILTTSITVYPLAFTQQNFSLCQGDSVMVGSSTYNQQGVYQDILQTWLGCDSTVTTSVIVLPVKTLTQTISLCEGGKPCCWEQRLYPKRQLHGRASNMARGL
ncbi:MAG: hypothetical protein IPM82_20580 [Saprospiraceae bacterium]|nr:hypothetical protein [Saprospiraceae bacterium]